jgi:hypothetical protein
MLSLLDWPKVITLSGFYCTLLLSKKFFVDLPLIIKFLNNNNKMQCRHKNIEHLPKYLSSILVLFKGSKILDHSNHPASPRRTTRTGCSGRTRPSFRNPESTTTSSTARLSATTIKKSITIQDASLLKVPVSTYSTVN